MQVLIASPGATARIDTRPGAQSCIATGLLVVTFLIASTLHLNTTDTAWTTVLAAGLLGAGLALSLFMTATLGVVGVGSPGSSSSAPAS